MGEGCFSSQHRLFALGPFNAGSGSKRQVLFRPPGTGRYYVYYTRGTWDGHTEAAVYYPGVVAQGQAGIAQIGAGQVRGDVVLEAPKQGAYSVRGFISTDEKSGLGQSGAVVVLIGLDGRIWHSRTVDFRGAFPLPRVKYFTFENVLPGRYIAYAVASGRVWLTKRVDVDVTTHAKLIFLELTHAKAGGHP